MPSRSPQLLDHEVYKRLTQKARTKLKALRGIMGTLARARKITPACFEASKTLEARGFKLSPERIRKLWYEFCEHGEEALIDHNLCGGKCGLKICSSRNKSALSQETIDQWVTLCEGNDKPSFAVAWRKMIAMLQEGEHIEGVGTWRTLWSRLNPTKPLPKKCPWSIHRPPHGWSMPSFLHRRPSKAEMLGAKKGLPALENELARSLSIRTDLSDLRFMEVVVFDDHRLDFKVYVGNQVVELWGVFAMDLATRTILAWGVRPRLASDDGTKQSITRRDMQHLIAGMLSTHGHPIEYNCTLLCENAAAAITEQVETDIFRATKGCVVVDRSGVGDGRSIGWEEKYGKPRGKRWLESWFNLLEIELGHIPGQMGNRWENQRADFKARERIGTKMLRLGVMDQIPEHVRPFKSLEEARDLIYDAILRTENREHHDLVNFETVREWRISESDTWKSCDEPFFLALPLDQQNALLGNTTTGLVRKETPRERRIRLHDPDAFTRLSEGATAFLLLDYELLKYAGTDAITFDKFGRTFDFSGRDHQCIAGQKIVVRFDADNPTHCAIEDGQGRILGVMHQRRASGYFDRERIGSQLGERQKVIGNALHNVRTRHADPHIAAGMDQAARIITAAVPQAKKQDDDSTVSNVITTLAKGQRKPESDAERYLKLKGKSRKPAGPVQPAPAPDPDPTPAPTINW